MGRTSRLAVIAALLGFWTGAQADERVYLVDATASDVHWLVYKAGALSRLGHNHTISVAGLKGRVTVDTERLAASRFELEFDVADLVVDDPALRQGLGEEFSSVPSASDIAGTKTNMLSERVLDGAMFPSIRITGAGPTAAAAGAQTLAIKVELLGRTVDLTVPTRVNVADDRVEASGEFELNHADLGMKPFSVMMGALQVGEKLSFSYRVVAHASP